jgi:hypothetical protein
MQMTGFPQSECKVGSVSELASLHRQGFCLLLLACYHFLVEQPVVVLEVCNGLAAGHKTSIVTLHRQKRHMVLLMLECTRLCWMGRDVSRMVAATAEEGLDLRRLLWKLSAMELSSSGSM